MRTDIRNILKPIVRIIFVIMIMTNGFAQLVFSAQANEEKVKPIKLLFIGNSYTYFNDFPNLLETMLNAGNAGRVEIKAVTEGGASLQRHWLKGEALAAINSQSWDYVVLQEQSQLGGQIIRGSQVINHPAFTHAFTRLFDQAIKHAGAKTLLTQTWTRQKRPEGQARLDNALVSIAKEIDAEIVPVGRVWERSGDVLASEVDLYTMDGSHPSPMGSLVQAGVFYRYLLQDHFDEDYAQIKNISFELTQELDQAKESLSLNQLNFDFYKLLVVAGQAIEELNAPDYTAIIDSSNYISPPELPSSEPFALSDLEGRWSGSLDYYQDSASFILDIQKEGERWLADVRIVMEDGTLIKTRRHVWIAPSKLSTNDFGLHIEATHDSFRGILVGDEIIGIVQGDHGYYPEPNRWGSWRLKRQVVKEPAL